MSEEMKDTSNIMEAAAADNAEQTALLEFTEQEILDYEEGELTKKEKAKFLFLSPLVNSIIKFSLIGLGLIAAIFWLLAAVVPGFSDSMVGLYNGFSTVVSAINNIIPFSVMEIAIILTVLGWLGYLIFILVRFIQTHKKGKLLAARLWIQFGYATLAVVMVYTMLFSFGYGIMNNRTSFHKATATDGAMMYDYTINPNENDISETMLYLVDKLNTTVIESNEGESDHIVYNTTTGASKVNIAGNTAARKDKLAAAVSDAFQKAAEEIPALKGPKLTPKAMLVGPIYNAMSVGSMYAPLTGEVLYNPNFPEIAIPMLVARAIAMERGFQNEAQANMIAYIVLTEYSDVPYVQYSAYFDAYVNTGNYMARCNIHTYATVASALKVQIKKEVVYYTKQLDKIFGNSSAIQFADNGNIQTPDADYLVFPELLTDFYRNNVSKVVDASIERKCGYYVNGIIDLWRQDADWQDNVDAVVAEYNEYKEEIIQETIENITTKTEDAPAEGTEGTEGAEGTEGTDAETVA